MMLNINFNLGLVDIIKEKIVQIAESIEDSDSRIVRIASALFSYTQFYEPLYTISVFVDQGMVFTKSIKSGYDDLTDAVRLYRGRTINHEFHSKVKKGTLSIAIAISCIAFYPFGRAINTATTVVKDTYIIGNQIINKSYTKDDIKGYAFNLTYNVLEIGSYVTTISEVLVVYTIMLVYDEVVETKEAYRQERYFEATARIGYAIIKSYLIIPEIKNVLHKWTKKAVRPEEADYLL